MDGNSVIEKLVDLSSLDLKDTKARRLFIVANGQKTLDELYKLCNFDKESGDELVQILLDGKFINLISHRASSSAQSNNDDNSITFTTDFIEKLTSEMANYVGPIASILVENIVTPEQTSTSSGAEEILNSLADSIESKEEKELFLIKMKSLLS